MSFDFAEADRRRPDPNPPNAIPNPNSSLGNERGSAADCPAVRHAAGDPDRGGDSTIAFSLYVWERSP
jgi:hypothetical protein